MVDTCDPAVCSWSEDGETFVVKHPKKFEQEIIPQFFKHSKFSSFVRQLNFYAFRKIKTNDSIRIDTALEAATANYWRFFHPKFQRGKPEWLQEIKRSSSTPRGAGVSKKGGATGNGKTAIPDAASSSGAVLGMENSELKSEVTNLKERIEAMNKNIDMLTTMVQNVSMSQKVKTEGEES
jgi:heat shock transcription factor 2